jgi:DNA-binding winged helix-turn-helix (wHTH) protein
LDRYLQTDPKLSPVRSGRYIHFGKFSIDQAAQRVFRGSTQLDVSGKCYAILIILVQKSGQVVTREEIKQALWPADANIANIDVASNINTRIHKLRQILGDSPSEAIYIETIPRKGYIFSAVPVFSSKALSQMADDVQDALNKAAFLVNDTQPLPQKSSWVGRRGITMILILAGILLLAVGMATYSSR